MLTDIYSCAHTRAQEVFNTAKAKKGSGEANLIYSHIDKILKLHLKELFYASFRDLRSLLFISFCIQGFHCEFQRNKEHSPRSMTNFKDQM